MTELEQHWVSVRNVGKYGHIVVELDNKVIIKEFYVAGESEMNHYCNITSMLSAAPTAQPDVVYVDIDLNSEDKDCPFFAGPFNDGENPPDNMYHHNRIVEALKAENDELKAKLDRMKWQDISTAPKDGTAVLLIISGRHSITNKPYEPVVLRWLGHEWGDDESEDNYSLFEPTHWKTLDAPEEDNALSSDG